MKQIVSIVSKAQRIAASVSNLSATPYVATSPPKLRTYEEPVDTKRQDDRDYAEKKLMIAFIAVQKLWRPAIRSLMNKLGYLDRCSNLGHCSKCYTSTAKESLIRDNQILFHHLSPPHLNFTRREMAVAKHVKKKKGQCALATVDERIYTSDLHQEDGHDQADDPPRPAPRADDADDVNHALNRRTLGMTSWDQAKPRYPRAFAQILGFSLTLTKEMHLYHRISTRM